MTIHLLQGEGERGGRGGGDREEGEGGRGGRGGREEGEEREEGEKKRRVMHTTESVLYALLLTGSRRCRQGAEVRETAGSSGRPPSLPALAASASLQ